MPTSRTGERAGHGPAYAALPRPPHPGGNFRGGFTLIEVLVVVVIIAVLAGMAALDLAGSAGPLRLRASARQAYHMARYAHAFAVSRGQPSRLVFDRSRKQVSMMVESDPQKNPGRWAPWTRDMMRPWTLPRGVALGKMVVRSGASGDAPRGGGASGGGDAPGGSVVEFRPDGTADAAVVELTDQTRTWSLSVTPATGRVDLTRGVIAHPPDPRRDLDLGS